MALPAGILPSPAPRAAGFSDLPNLKPHIHAIQVEIVMFLGESGPNDWFGQEDLIKLGRTRAEAKHGRGYGMGMEALEHLHGIGVLAQWKSESGETGPYWRLSDRGRQTYAKLLKDNPLPEKADVIAEASRILDEAEHNVTAPLPASVAAAQAAEDRLREIDVAALTVEDVPGLDWHEVRRVAKELRLPAGGGKDAVYGRVRDAIAARGTFKAPAKAPPKAPGRTVA